MNWRCDTTTSSELSGSAFPDSSDRFALRLKCFLAGPRWRTCTVRSCLRSPPKKSRMSSSKWTRIQRSKRGARSCACLFVPRAIGYRTRSRRVCIASILHTDNANHFDMVREISKARAAQLLGCCGVRGASAASATGSLSCCRSTS